MIITTLVRATNLPYPVNVSYVLDADVGYTRGGMLTSTPEPIDNFEALQKYFWKHHRNGAFAFEILWP